MKWKRKTMQKYGYACACCGHTLKEDLTVHHIKPKSLYPQLIDVESNLVVLCYKCHLFLHEVITNDDLSKCDAKALEQLYVFKGNKRGAKVRQKAKYRKW